MPPEWESRGYPNGYQSVELDNPVTATHIRLFIPANAGYTQWGGVIVNELEAYGYPAPVAPTPVEQNIALGKAVAETAGQTTLGDIGAPAMSSRSVTFIRACWGLRPCMSPRKTPF